MAGALVGRTHELAVLREALDGSRGDGLTVVLLTGEPGIGKSRLVSEACRLAEERQALVLSGFALDTPGLPAYFAVRTAFNATRTGDVPSEGVADFVPALEAGSLWPSPGAAKLEPLPPEQARIRSFESVTRVIGTLASECTVLLALDDLQWADVDTWDVLAYLASALRGADLVIVLATRDAALRDAGSPAARTVDALNRLRVLRHLALARLNPEATAGLAAGVLGAPGNDVLVESVTRRSGGNPFFVEELLRDLRERGQLVHLAGTWQLADNARLELPLTVRLAIGQRLARLSEGAQRALRMAAVIGRRWDFDLLAAALGVDARELAEMLEAARRAGLIERFEETWRFSHDLVREALLDVLIDSAGLHEQVARALDSVVGAADLETLRARAHHWRQASRRHEGVRATLDAAGAALQQAAWDAAEAEARSALDLTVAYDDVQCLEAAEMHASATFAAGRFAETDVSARRVIQLAGALGERERAVRGEALLAEALQRSERASEAAAAFEAVLQHARSATVPDRLKQELPGILTSFAELEGVTRAHFQRGKALAEEASALAARLGDPRAEARALIALADIRSRAGELREARPHLDSALEHALAAGDRATAARACAALANSYVWTGELGASWRAGQRRLALSEAIDDVFDLRHGHSWLALLATTRGEWRRATELLDEAEPLLARLHSPEPVAYVHYIRSFIAYRQGRLGQAEALLQQALDGFAQADASTPVWYAALGASISLDAGDVTRARSRMVALEHQLESVPPESMLALHARNQLALVYERLDERDRGVETERLLRPHAGHYYAGQVHLSLAALASLRGDARGALAHLDSAELQAREEGMEPELALGLLRRAELFPAGTPARGAALAEAAPLLERLGMRVPLERARALERREAPSPQGLTLREVEVLRLVTNGLTNRQIAGALVISERTVANHLAHILQKSGEPNRAGAAAWALRHGLV